MSLLNIFHSAQSKIQKKSKKRNFVKSLIVFVYIMFVAVCLLFQGAVNEAHKLQKQMQLTITSKLEKRSNSVPTNNNSANNVVPNITKELDDLDIDEEDQPRNNKSMAEVTVSSSSSGVGSGDVSTTRPSISNENNILLDPEILNDQVYIPVYV